MKDHQSHFKFLMDFISKSLYTYAWSQINFNPPSEQRDSTEKSFFVDGKEPVHGMVLIATVLMK